MGSQPAAAPASLSEAAWLASLEPWAGGESFELANGLRVILLSDPEVPLVAVEVGYPSGSALDPEGQSGRAHLCEHLSFCAGTGPCDGTWTNLDLARWVEDHGGVAQGRTSHDRTSFGTLVAAEHLEWVLHAEQRRMMLPAAGLNAENLDRQRDIICRERLETVDARPYGQAFEWLHARLYPDGHPYRRLPIGVLEELRSLEIGDVRRGLVEHYVPAGAVLAVAGRFDSGPVRALAERLFGAAPRIEPPPRPAAAAEPAAINAHRHHVVVAKVPAIRSYLAFRIPVASPAERLQPSLLAKCLCLGRDRPLQRRLVRELGVARDVEATTVSMRNAVTLVFSATAADGVEEGRLAAALTAGVEAELEHSVTEDSLARAVERTLAERLSAAQYVQQRAEMLATAAVYGEPHPELAPWGTLDADRMRRLAARLCPLNNAVTLSIVPGRPSS